MKKQLLQEMQEIAQELLTYNEATNMKQLKDKIGLLQEKVVLLNYFEKQLNVDAKRTDLTQSFDSKSYREQNWFKDPKPVPSPENKEEIVELATEKIKDIVAQMPPNSEKVDALLEEVLPPKKYIKNDLEDLAAHYQKMPIFERKDQTQNHSQPQKLQTINDKTAAKDFTFGLNDKIAFTNQLFEGNSADFARVINQLKTFSNYQEAQNFIQNIIKPDYNNWVTKETFETRFLELIEKQFSS